MTMLATCSVLVLLGLSAIFDLYYRRVPNLITGISAVIGLIFPWVGGGGVNVTSSYLGGSLAFMLLLPPYLIGTIGAGDVKLFGASGLFLGVNEVLSALICIALMGGLLALLYLLATVATTMCRHQRVSNVALRSIELPYAVAIFAGILFLIFKESIV